VTTGTTYSTTASAPRTMRSGSRRSIGRSYRQVGGIQAPYLVQLGCEAVIHPENFESAHMSTLEHFHSTKVLIKFSGCTGADKSRL